MNTEKFSPSIHFRQRQSGVYYYETESRDDVNLIEASTDMYEALNEAFKSQRFELIPSRIRKLIVDALNKANPTTVNHN